MNHRACLQVYCDNKPILDKIQYSFFNISRNEQSNGKLDANGRTKAYYCDEFDIVYTELFLNGIKLATVHQPTQKTADFSKSTYTLKLTTASTSQTQQNTTSVKVKNKLEIELDKLNATAYYFANNCLRHDAHLREIYIRKVKEMSNHYLKLAESGKMTVEVAACEASSLRNEILEGIRQKNSPVGRATAEKEKLKTKTLSEFLEYYALQEKDPEKFETLKNQGRKVLDDHVKASAPKIDSYFNQLSIEQKNRVYYSIIKGAGKTSPKFNSKIFWMKWIGRVIAIVTYAYAGFEILTAENKEKEAYRQGITIGGSIAGGAAGGAVAGLACGPGSPVCSFVGMAVGSAVGGFAAYELVDAFDKELEAFTAWHVF